MIMGELETPVATLLRVEQELTGFFVSYVPPEGWAVVDEREIWITLYFGEERIVLALVQRAGPGYEHETLNELTQRVRSALQDWIAESKFGSAPQR